jgi:hypothetical protein
VFNNRLHDAESHALGIVSEGSGMIDGLFIYNNTIFQNGADGILIYNWLEHNGYPNLQPLARNIQIFNNTLYRNNLLNNSSYGGIDLDHDFVTDVRIFNNISFGNYANQIRDRSNRTTAVRIEGNVTADPLFRSISTADFSVTSGSPAIDVGLTNPPALMLNGQSYPFDFDATSTRRSASPDVGALESSPGTGTPAFIAALNARLGIASTSTTTPTTTTPTTTTPTVTSPTTPTTTAPPPTSPRRIRVKSK